MFESSGFYAAWPKASRLNVWIPFIVIEFSVLHAACSNASRLNGLINSIFFDTHQTASFVNKIDLMGLMEDAISTLEDVSLTIDGIHLSPLITDALFQLSTQTIRTVTHLGSSLRIIRAPVHLSPSIPKEVNDHDPSTLSQPPRPSVQFVGRDPILGLAVGLYLLVALLLGDPFLVLKLSTRLLN